jgi:hypothetical protein
LKISLNPKKNEQKKITDVKWVRKNKRK